MKKAMRATLMGRYRAPPGPSAVAAPSSAALSVRRARARGSPNKLDAKIRGITPVRGKSRQEFGGKGWPRQAVR